MESTLNLHKNRILGSLPKSRDDFDPSSLLSKLDGGEKIVVCDSNTDLPRNWRDIDLKEAFGSLGGDVPDLEANAARSLVKSVLFRRELMRRVLSDNIWRQEDYYGKMSQVHHLPQMKSPLLGLRLPSSQLRGSPG